MPTFAYQVRDKEGKKIKGIMEASSERGVAERLTALGYLITTIAPAKNFKVFLNQVPKSIRVSSDDLTMFYFQLSNIVEAGIPVVKALETTSEQLRGRSLRKVIQNLSSRITGGESLSEAMAYHEHVFPFLYRSMIRVGETSGSLAQTLRHIAELNESTEELRHQVRSAFAYPIILIVASIAVVIFMMVWIVPAFMVIFNKAGIALPLPTRIIYGISMAIKAHPFFLLGTVIAAWIGGQFLIQIEKFKYYWDYFCLSMPSIGLLIRRIEIARWSRNMTLMLSSGVPILQTLEIVKGLTQNLVFKQIFEETYIHVQGGGKLADTLQRSNIIPSDVVQMVSTGENSGTLDQMLLKVAQFYDLLIARMLKKLTSLIEPVFILFLGAVVGLIMLAVLLPIFEMIKIFTPQ